MTRKGFVWIFIPFAFLNVQLLFSKTSTFNAFSGNDWSEPLNWDNGVPGSGDTAIIPTGELCKVELGTAQCKNLELTGIIEITGNSGSGTRDLQVGVDNLGTQGGTVTIDGELRFKQSGSRLPRLALQVNVTFVGEGLITASDADGCVPGTIIAIGTDAAFTLNDADLTAKGELIINPNIALTAGTLLVDDADDAMLLGPTSGDVALTGSGALVVSAGSVNFRDVNLSSGGACDWDVTLSGGEIDINSAASATGSTMTYAISGGTLDVNSAHAAASFTVSGGTADFNAAFSGGSVSISSSGTFRVDAASTGATSSNFTITGGTLDVNAALTAQNFTISGGTIAVDDTLSAKDMVHPAIPGNAARILRKK